MSLFVFLWVFLFCWFSRNLSMSSTDTAVNTLVLLLVLDWGFVLVVFMLVTLASQLALGLWASRRLKVNSNENKYPLFHYILYKIHQQTSTNSFLLFFSAAITCHLHLKTCQNKHTRMNYLPWVYRSVTSLRTIG